MRPRPDTAEPHADASSMRIAVVVSRYHADVTSRLLDGARTEFVRLRGDASKLVVLHAPGSYELPVIARAAAQSHKFDAIVALGCVVRGQTTHDRHIASAVADGLMRVAVETGVPVAFGVLTVENMEQAEARSVAVDPSGSAHGENKGVEAVRAAVEAASVIRAINALP